MSRDMYVNGRGGPSYYPQSTSSASLMFSAFSSDFDLLIPPSEDASLVVAASQPSNWGVRSFLRFTLMLTKHKEANRTEECEVQDAFQNLRSGPVLFERDE